MNGFGEPHCKVDLAARRPPLRLAKPGHERVALDPDLRPEDLAVVVVDAAHEIENDVRGPRLRERIAVEPDPIRGGELDLDLRVVERHGVIPRRRRLARVRKARPVAGVGVLRGVGLQLQRAERRHQEHVPHVRVPGPAEVGMGEAQDRRVAIPVSGRPRVALAERTDVGIGAQLDHAEWHRRAGVRVAVSSRSDERIDVVERRLSLLVPDRGGGGGRVVDRGSAPGEETGREQDEDREKSRSGQ